MKLNHPASMKFREIPRKTSASRTSHCRWKLAAEEGRKLREEREKERAPAALTLPTTTTHTNAATSRDGERGGATTAESDGGGIREGHAGTHRERVHGSGEGGGAETAQAEEVAGSAAAVATAAAAAAGGGDGVVVFRPPARNQLNCQLATQLFSIKDASETGQLISKLNICGI